MENICDVIWMTHFGDVIFMTLQNDVIFMIFEVLLCHKTRPQIGQTTQLLITETQKKIKLTDILSFFLTLNWQKE